MDQNPTTQPGQSGNAVTPDQSKLHPMVVLQPGERVICEIKRHAIGILGMYLSGGFAIVLAIVLAILAPKYLDQYSSAGSDVGTMVAVAVVIVIVGVATMLWIATSIYWQNRWIVTDDSITQILQNGLFGRKVSQLSMENLEDVTVDQQGILQSMFNFGTLKAETAGERSKFIFNLCPNPNAYARKILEVHETFLHQVRHQPQNVNPVTPMSSPYAHDNDFQYPPSPVQNQPQYGQNPTQPLQEPQFQPTEPGSQQVQPQYQYQQPASQQPPQWPRYSPVPDNGQQQQSPYPQGFVQPGQQQPADPTQPQQQVDQTQRSNPAIWGN